MEITVKESEAINGELKFPLLMKSKFTSAIVWMFSYGTGIVVCSGRSTNNIGVLIDVWEMKNFAPFKGKIILENN